MLHCQRAVNHTHNFHHDSFYDKKKKGLGWPKLQRDPNFTLINLDKITPAALTFASKEKSAWDALPNDERTVTFVSWCYCSLLLCHSDQTEDVHYPPTAS